MFRASFSLKACAAARVFEEGASRLAKGRKENGRARTDSLARAKKKREREEEEEEEEKLRKGRRQACGGSNRITVERARKAVSLFPRLATRIESWKLRGFLDGSNLI